MFSGEQRNVCPYIEEVRCLKVYNTSLYLEFQALSNADGLKSKYCPSAAGPRIVQNSRSGLRKMMYYLKYDEIGLLLLRSKYNATDLPSRISSHSTSVPTMGFGLLKRSLMHYLAQPII